MTNGSQKPDTEDPTWLDELAGKVSADDSDADQQMANTIRRFVTAEQAAAEESVSDEELAHGKQRLMFRLKQERLLKPAKPAWQAPWAMAASLAAVGMVALLTFTNLPDGTVSEAEILMSYGELEIMRGARPDPFVVVTDDPDRSARQLARQLESIQVAYELSTIAENPANRLIRIQFDGSENQAELQLLLSEQNVTEITTSIVEIRFESTPDN